MIEKTRQPSAESRRAAPDHPPRTFVTAPKLSSPKDLSSSPDRTKLRVISGGNQPRERELASSGDVIRLLAAAAAEMMLRKISPLRAHEIQRQASKALLLFEKQASASQNDAELNKKLKRELRQLGAVWRERQSSWKKT